MIGRTYTHPAGFCPRGNAGPPSGAACRPLETAA